MATEQSKLKDDLKTVLAEFETSLETPLLSGELPNWIEDVQKTWSEASAQIHYHIQHVHPRQYEQIGNQDAAMLPRVEQLQAEDAEIEKEREKLGHSIQRAAQHVPKLEPDEGKAQQHMKKLIDEGLGFVTRVRKQEVAIETWFVEAFTRDRGEVD